MSGGDSPRPGGDGEPGRPRPERRGPRSGFEQGAVVEPRSPRLPPAADWQARYERDRELRHYVELL